MFNQVRTLLLNVSGDKRPGPDFPGEQYVLPSYRQRPLSPEMLQVRRVLFGPAPDRAMLNYRLQQLLCLIHGCELAEYVYLPDPRITYWPFDDSLLRLVVRGPVVTQVQGDDQLLSVLSPAVSYESAGRLKLQWRIGVLSSTTVSVQTFNDNGLTSATLQAYTIVDGLSNLLVLPGSGLYYRFAEGVGAAWLIDVLARPSVSLLQLEQQAQLLLGDAVTTLFGSPLIEPYRTFSNLYHQHDEPTYRLAALTLALAYRTAEEV